MFFGRQYFAGPRLPPLAALPALPAPAVLPALLVLVALFVSWPVAGQPPVQPPDRPPVPSNTQAAVGESPEPTAASMGILNALAVKRIVESIEDPAVREFVDEVLVRNPGIAVAEARARAALQRAPQVKALPNPEASLTAFLKTPETRTGPQRLSAGIFQGLPWSGKLALKEQAALHEAAALEAEVEARRLKLVTEARRLVYELAFLDRYDMITEEFLSHLLQHEGIARSRYSTGFGSGQGVVKLQAEITRVESKLLELERRRVKLGSQLNALRDRPALTSVSVPPDLLSSAAEVGLNLDRLIESALRVRPELAAADARIARTEALIRLSEKDYRPDFKVGLTFTVVDPRDDTPGRLQPPESNGDDILAIQGGISLPIWRKKLTAGVEEAIERQTAAEQTKRDIIAGIEAAIGDLAQQVPLGWRQLRLVEDLLIVQAEEALESARAGYITGSLNALDLLDAEHVLFEANTGVARAKADYLVGLAKLEGALGHPLEPTTYMERSES